MVGVHVCKVTHCVLLLTELLALQNLIFARKNLDIKRGAVRRRDRWITYTRARSPWPHTATPPQRLTAPTSTTQLQSAAQRAYDTRVEAVDDSYFQLGGSAFTVL